MATSGTVSFSPDNATLLEEIFELAGLELRTGNDFESAMRSADFLKLQWANEGLNLWTVEETTIAITAGEESYTLAADTIDLLDHAIRDGTGDQQVDYRLKRIAFPRWAGLTTKNETGRPMIILVERKNVPTIRVWPVPDTNYTLVVWRLRYMQDAGGATNTLDMPLRLIPAFIWGMAYTMACKRPKEVSMEHRMFLKGEYNTMFQAAKDEDRDRASFFIRPRTFR
jgi:hypothetical protein